MAKKEGRLSPKARKMLDEVRKKFSHDPEKATQYLMSVKPKDWNLYDRQKIGREILAKKSYYNAESIIDDYDLSIPEPRKPGESYKRLQGIRSAKNIFKLAQIETSPGIAADFYEHAGALFERADDTRHALESYEKAFDAKKRFNEMKGMTGGEDWKDWEFGSHLEKAIARLKKKRKPTPRLEEAVDSVIAILGLLVAIFFLSSNLTGAVIGNMTNSTSNIIGVISLIVGLVAGFFYFKRK